MMMVSRSMTRSTASPNKRATARARSWSSRRRASRSASLWKDARALPQFVRRLPARLGRRARHLPARRAAPWTPHRQGGLFFEQGHAQDAHVPRRRIWRRASPVSSLAPKPPRGGDGRRAGARGPAPRDVAAALRRLHEVRRRLPRRARSRRRSTRACARATRLVWRRGGGLAICPPAGGRIVVEGAGFGGEGGDGTRLPPIESPTPRPRAAAPRGRTMQSPPPPPAGPRTRARAEPLLQPGSTSWPSCQALPSTATQLRGAAGQSGPAPLPDLAINRTGSPVRLVGGIGLALHDPLPVGSIDQYSASTRAIELAGALPSSHATCRPTGARRQRWACRRARRAHSGRARPWARRAAGSRRGHFHPP